jgi:hypothetical protein
MYYEKRKNLTMNLITNTGTSIDWNQVVARCKSATGTTMQYNRKCFPDTQDFKELDRLWQEAGYFYDDPSIEWTNYFSEDFGQEVVDAFQDIVKAKPLMAWVSKIRPGLMAPWHYDAHQKIEEFKKQGNLVRYTCYIQDPQHGHVSVVGESAVYRPVKGSVYQWPTYDAWHCGMNGGLTDKFMFNYWGAQ